ncbi:MULTISPECIES: RIP metalloprotease RseP [Paenibacillus]|uniref:Zinc metalloprotease n=1 Tax=Paenibacillus barengoltzii J12 TaxID=935846 RepID=A0ABY1LWE0_9BACL|nr:MULTISPECIES: RIP metalloprotease RseP [Paenibacillus]MCT2195064.1 RIP metalloprotease RseP [Paenibacillus sp. p3-SID1389]SME92945.1 regulator of sigma E protease [Paenibacillus barengoltzii]SMF16873.1 regulator of sigma E protease [Paenibacillus barengoltzii J12]
MELLKIIFLTVLMFFVIVTVHEWGHYFFAKRAGILVREFAIGFGPKLLSFKRGETQFTLRLLPFGGYARMAGEDPELIQISDGQTIALRLENDKVRKIYLDRLDSRKNVIRGEVQHIDLEDDLAVRLNVDGEALTYRVHPQAMLVAKGKETQIAPRDRQYGSKTVGQRALSIFAGPLMNFILAFVLFALHTQMAGIPLDQPSHLQIGEVMKGMPAEEVGLKTGDIIETINGTPVGTDANKMIEMIQASKNKPMTWTIKRGDETLNITITPKGAENEDGKIGSTIVTVFPTRSASFGETFQVAGEDMVNTTKAIFLGFKQLINRFNMDDLGGPVRTFEVTGQIAKQGIVQLTYWAAILSLYLGIFNLLPIPALDGSRLIFLGVEALRGKPIDPNREGMVHFIGFAMLFLLMIAVTYNDILRLIHG